MRTAHIFGVLFLSLLSGRVARADVPPDCDDPIASGSRIQDNPVGEAGANDADAGRDAGSFAPSGGSCGSSGSSGSCSMSRVGIDASIGGLMLMVGVVSLLASRRPRR